VDRKALDLRLRTNKHFTPKENPLKRTDLDDFVACYDAKNRHERKESERFKCFTCEELTKRDKLSFSVPSPRCKGSIDFSNNL
jgi:type I restriction enzyme M protein